MKQAQPVIWSEADIRRELLRLDGITGLNGASLPISFGNARCTLGMYYNEKRFYFSNYYFQDPNWPKSCALDTIRHEYAHYMNHMLYGDGGHNATWKRCCNIVGASPKRLYDPETAVDARDKLNKVHEKQKRLKEYTVGTVILHPVFGIGTIEKLVGAGMSRSAEILFEDGSVRKTIALDWIDRNCLKE